MLALQLVGKNGFPPDSAVVARDGGGVVNIGSITPGGGVECQGCSGKVCGDTYNPSEASFL